MFTPSLRNTTCTLGVMCGISGVVGPPSASTVIEEQLELLHHRGPNARGALRREHGARRPEPPVDHRPRDRRPADHERGPHRGASSSTARSTTSASCATSCAATGHEFGSEGDTEVIAHLAEDLPPVELARRLDGMFALRRLGRAPAPARARPRPRRQEAALLLVRADGRLVFGSEIKARARRPGGAARARPAGDPRLPDVRLRADAAHVLRGRPSLPPGHVLTLERGRRARRSSATGAAARGHERITRRRALARGGRARGPRSC